LRVKRITNLGHSPSDINRTRVLHMTVTQAATAKFNPRSLRRMPPRPPQSVGGGTADHANINGELLQLHKQFEGPLLRCAVSLVRDLDLARDAVQDTFVHFLLHRRRGLIIDNPQAWLFRMLHTVCRTSCFTGAVA
jgi:hypothetical protein